MIQAKQVTKELMKDMKPIDPRVVVLLQLPLPASDWVDHRKSGHLSLLWYLAVRHWNYIARAFQPRP